MFRKTLIIVMVLIVGLSLAPVSIVDAVAEPKSLCSCTYSDCDGWYPDNHNCSGTTLASTFIMIPSNVGLNELRYSSGCHSYWARTSLSASSYYLGSTVDGPGTDYSEASPAPLSSGQQVYTRMVTSAAATRACGNVSDSHAISIPVYSFCTNYHINN